MTEYKLLNNFAEALSIGRKAGIRIIDGTRNIASLREQVPVGVDIKLPDGKEGKLMQILNEPLEKGVTIEYQDGDKSMSGYYEWNGKNFILTDEVRIR